MECHYTINEEYFIIIYTINEYCNGYTISE